MLDTIYNAIMKVRSYPGIYLRCKSLSLLYAYISGIECCLTNNWTEIKEKTFTGIFNDWIISKYSTPKTLDYTSVILKRSDHDEEKAFDLFYELLFEYLESKSK